jgi:glutathione S-transferase
VKLYAIFGSGTSHRLRIALNRKGLRYEQVAVDLRREEHLDDDYRWINPQQLVPALDNGGRLTAQSPSVIEWIEGGSRDADQRAQVSALTAIVGCDIHPVNNRRVFETLAIASAPTTRPRTTDAARRLAAASTPSRRWWMRTAPRVVRRRRPAHDRRSLSRAADRARAPFRGRHATPAALVGYR